MGPESAIDWTEASWNPSTGCTKISLGCKNCYAETWANSLKAKGLKKYSDGFNFRIHPDTLNLPLRWRRPRMIFVNSMSDLFHPDMPIGFLYQIFDVMQKADWHVYQILTKRPERMTVLVGTYQNRFGKFSDNVWFGTTVESADVTDRLDALAHTPCLVRFVSAEPLLTPLPNLNLTGVHWMIVGGESGPNFRPMSLDWVRDIRDQSVSLGIPFFFKQLAGKRPLHLPSLDGKIWNEYPKAARDRLHRQPGLHDHQRRG